MAKLLGFLGATAGSTIGWWAGEHIGIMTAYVISMVGMAGGLWASRWVVRNYLD